MRKIIAIIFFIFAMQSCDNKAKENNLTKKQNEITKSNNNASKSTTKTSEKNIEVNKSNNEKLKNSIKISKIHKPNSIICDLDGDNLSDTVQIVMNTINKKYGLKIIFGNKKIEYLGMGKEIAGQGFDDIDWVGIFEVAPKNEIYYNNVNDDGEIIMEDEVKETDKIRLPNDGIFIHQAESCGGGVIYLKNGKFEWIQQE